MLAGRRLQKVSFGNPRLHRIYKQSMAKSALRWESLPWLCDAINPPTRTSLAASRIACHGQRVSLRISPLLQLASRHRQCVSPKRLFNKRFQSTKPPTHPLNHSSPESSLSLTQRMRKLSREYGWSALAVYLLLSALDFPLCFIAVRWLGTDRIGHWEHIVLKAFWEVVPYPFPSRPAVQIEGLDGSTTETETVGSRRAPAGVAAKGYGLREAEQLNQSENASESLYIMELFDEMLC